MSRRGDYGYDAPAVLGGFVIGVLVSIAAVASGFTVELRWLAAMGEWTGTIGIVCGGSYLYATRRGKHVVWQRLLDELALRGDETVVDVGCGRGAVLLLAAAGVPRGKAIGVDIWATRDQSGNAEAVTRRNAELEGVADRVELVTADMRELPLPDASADLVVSSLAIHNVRGAAERARALAEIARVLRPGGRCALVDISFTRAYADELASHGLTVARRGLGPRVWFGGPQVRATLVLATKPA